MLKYSKAPPFVNMAFLCAFGPLYRTIPYKSCLYVYEGKNHSFCWRNGNPIHVFSKNWMYICFLHNHAIGTSSRFFCTEESNGSNIVEKGGHSIAQKTTSANAASASP